MKKIGFILDSFSAMSKDELAKNSIEYIPLRVELDSKVYNDGIDASASELLNLMAKSTSVKTSLPSLEWMENTFSKMSKEYEHVIYLPVSSKLSGTYNAAKTISKDFDNIYVVDNGFCGYQYLHAINLAKVKFDQTNDIKETIKYIEDINKSALTMILPFNLKYLIEGGRLSTLKKFMLKSLQKIKLYPYVKFLNNGDLSFSGLARSVKNSISQMIDKISDHVKLPTHKLLDEFQFQFIFGIDEENNKLIREELKKHNLNDYIEIVNSSLIAAHTGPEAISLSIIKK